MIEVIGVEGTSEYEAAIAIRDAISRLWPGIETSPASKEHVCIAASVKISGYRVSDIDIVVCGVFNRDRKFIPRKVLHDQHGKSVGRRPVTIQNFVLAIEVKDHDESGVRITGENVDVYYSRGAKRGWKSATEQNISQVHSLCDYLDDLGHEAFVHRCLIMQGLGSISVGGALASGFDGNQLFTSLAAVSKVYKTVSGFTLSSGANVDITPILTAPIFKLIIPTALDRQRMDRIALDTDESLDLLENMGKRLVRLRGYGGTGKTIMCLQMAWKAFEERGYRTLVLTYNHALAADIRRILALMHVPTNPEEGGIAVETVMSFMYSWFRRLQLLEEDEDLSYDNYEKNCDAAVELLVAGAISQEDIDKIVSENPDRYDYDCVVVDEAQDWPQGEADLLKLLYTPQNICLADGVDQLVRGSRTNWEHDVEESLSKVISLDTCLRMKRNLAVFVNNVANASGVNWHVTPNAMAGGGKVIILQKPYTTSMGLHERLVHDAKSKGNAELDFLYCVPPASVSVDVDGKKYSDIGKGLAELENKVWDGVDAIARKDFPRSRKQFRVVQYASCRGLEGWTVVLHNIDQYWQDRYTYREKAGLTEEEELAYEDIQEVAARYAWHQVLIAFTRPIDTLVIGLNDMSSTLSTLLLHVARNNQEFVEIID